MISFHIVLLTTYTCHFKYVHIDGLMQDCSNPSVSVGVTTVLYYCTKPMISFTITEQVSDISPDWFTA